MQYAPAPYLDQLGISILNYPPFSLAIADGQPIYGVFTRTVTNVGSPNSTYAALMSVQPGFTIAVDPPVLSLSALGEKKSFTVKVTGPKISQQPIISYDIMWQDSNCQYLVRSPIVVYNVLPIPYSYYVLHVSKETNIPTSFHVSQKMESLDETKNHVRI
ncbi:hypothetical protein REPUB_Repub08aG0190100 [Reevesia pubescens]